MVHAMSMKLMWNDCGIVMEWLVIEKKLVLYGLSGYELVIDGFSCDGDVKYTLLFYKLSHTAEYLDKERGSKPGATRAGGKKICGAKEIKIIS